MLALLIFGIFIYHQTESVAFTVASLFVVGLFVAGIVAVVIQSSIEAFWRRAQPDYQEFRKYEAAKDAHVTRLSEWIRTQEAWWQSLDGPTFEEELGAFFQKQGYRVSRTGQSGDGGVDLILTEKDGESIIVQCKAHKRPVGPAPVRDLYGTLIHRGNKEAWLVSSTGFSRAAREFATSKPIRLLSIREILQFADFPLDLAVEVLSPSDTVSEMQKKDDRPGPRS